MSLAGENQYFTEHTKHQCTKVTIVVYLQKLKALLEIVGKIIYAHTDPDVLETCAKTLEYLCTEATAIYTTCDIERSNIIDECVKRYMEAIDEWRNLIEGLECFPRLHVIGL